MSNLVFVFFCQWPFFLLFWGGFGNVKTLEEEIFSTSKTFFSVQSKLSCIRYVVNVKAIVLVTWNVSLLSINAFTIS